VEYARIIGIKDSSGDISHMLRMMAALEAIRPDFTFLSGWGRALASMLAMGCQCATLAMSGVVPEVTRKLHESTTEGRLAEARAQQAQLTKLFDFVINCADCPEGVGAAVEVRGFHVGASRQPHGEEQPVDREKLSRLISDLLASC
jgi:4-hydroxy-tetrahydrodipicolinate synthase